MKSKKKFRVKRLFLLSLVLVMLIPTVAFAGQWYYGNFDTRIKVSSYETPEIKDTRGMPGIRFYVSAEPSTRTVKVELLVKEYIPKPIEQGGGWQFVVKQSQTASVGSNQTKYISMNWLDGLIIGDAKYRIIVQGAKSRLDGSYEFFIE